MNKDKKSIWIAIFIVILYGSASGNYLNSGDDYLYNNSSWLGLIDFLIGSVIMMIVPFICRLKNKNLLPYKLGKRICMWNSIYLLMIPVILFVLSDFLFVDGISSISDYYIYIGLDADDINNGIEAAAYYFGYNILNVVMYYYINKWLFVDYMNLGVSTNHQAESTTKFKCSLCGAICNEDDKYCKNCQAVFEDEDEDETEEESET